MLLSQGVCDGGENEFEKTQEKCSLLGKIDCDEKKNNNIERNNKDYEGSQILLWTKLNVGR